MLKYLEAIPHSLPPTHPISRISFTVLTKGIGLKTKLTLNYTNSISRKKKKHLLTLQMG